MKKEDIIRIPPDMLGEDIDTILEKLAHKNFEGKVIGSNLILLATNIEKVGEGRIVHGDGGVYQQVRYDALIFTPEMHEIIEGTVCEVLKFGVFVRFGPLDGLLHISQIMDDRINVDLANERLIGKDTKRDLRVGDKVRARIVAVSVNERNPRESKIGLTMRQPSLGKLEWIEAERKKGKEKVERKPAVKRGRRERRK